MNHIIQHKQCLPRPVLVHPPGDTLSIPTPAMLLAQHCCGEHVYSCEVALWGELHIIVLPTWVEERRPHAAH